MITQLMPPEVSPTHPLRSTAGPLTAALTLARQYPLLPATSVEVRYDGLLVSLHGADAESFSSWVAELGLTESAPRSYVFRAGLADMLSASGSFAGVELRVVAYPRDRVLTAVAS